MRRRITRRHRVPIRPPRPQKRTTPRTHSGPLIPSEVRFCGDLAVRPFNVLCFAARRPLVLMPVGAVATRRARMATCIKTLLLISNLPSAALFLVMPAPISRGIIPCRSGASAPRLRMSTGSEWWEVSGSLPFSCTQVMCSPRRRFSSPPRHA